MCDRPVIYGREVPFLFGHRFNSGASGKKINQPRFFFSNMLFYDLLIDPVDDEYIRRSASVDEVLAYSPDGVDSYGAGAGPGRVYRVKDAACFRIDHNDPQNAHRRLTVIEPVMETVGNRPG